MVATMIASGELDIAEALASQPIGRFGRADEVASTVLWLCSPAPASSSASPYPWTAGTQRSVAQRSYAGWVAGQRRLARRAVLPQAVGRPRLAHPLRRSAARFEADPGIATEDDGERLDYLESHLAAVAQALREGVDVRGYIHWSAFDNFEWSEGYGPKFGLIAVDHHRNFARTPKPSAYAYARVAATGRLAELGVRRHCA